MPSLQEHNGQNTLRLPTWYPRRSIMRSSRLLRNAEAIAFCEIQDHYRIERHVRESLDSYGSRCKTEPVRIFGFRDSKTMLPVLCNSRFYHRLRIPAHSPVNNVWRAPGAATLQSATLVSNKTGTR